MARRNLAGLRTIVTGATSGIGRALAIELIRQGACVVGMGRREERLRELEEAIAAPERFAWLAGDVTQPADRPAAIDLCCQRFGGLDALVNNAGIADPHTGPLEKLELREWNRRIGVNLTGCFLMAKHATPHLRRARGAIVNIASTRALQSEPDTEAYAASKGGLVAFTHALAMSLGPQVRVNCISPGWIAHQPVGKKDHAQHPVGRVGRSGDIAALVAYLLSDAAGFVTGQNFVVDGGMTKKMIYEE
jgi:NAD(P)-dependent dehydrogenase (short-subunit alcohol dehydrogenase family)